MEHSEIVKTNVILNCVPIYEINGFINIAST